MGKRREGERGKGGRVRGEKEGGREGKWEDNTMDIKRAMFSHKKTHPRISKPALL